MIAEVILNSTAKNLNKTFDYIVPTLLENKIEVGVRVFVPFGKLKKLEQGFVVSLKEDSKFANKEIASIEQVEGLTKENINLAILMARRYFCNISDCLKLMLPPGTAGKALENRAKEKIGEFVYLKKEAEDVLADIEAGVIKTPKQVRSLQFLLENQGIHILDLESITDTTRAVTKALEKKEYIEIIEEKIERNPFEFKTVKRDTPLPLTEEQQFAFQKVAQAIDEERFQEYLLYGVTGSRQNRSIFAINSKNVKKGQKGNDASSRNFLNTANGK